MLYTDLLRGPLLEHWNDALSLNAVLCDLRSRFIPKCCIGAGYRAISRNGKILLASRRPIDELSGTTAVVRFQTWHRAILPNDPREPYGLLMCVRSCPEVEANRLHIVRLTAAADPASELIVDCGGGMALEFVRAVECSDRPP